MPYSSTSINSLSKLQQSQTFPEYMPDGSQWPRISIVTSSYNQGEFIEQTICSVLLQGYPNLEYIIIDGGSTDNTVEIIKKYEQYLTYWVSESDLGQYDAINKGFSHSTGEIMAWLNSDDMYFSCAFKTVASVFSKFSEVEWITTLNPASWDWNGDCSGISSIPGYCKAAFLDGYFSPGNKHYIGWIQQESTFWRRSLWSKVNSNLRTEYDFASDFDLWTRFFAHADLYGIQSILGGFRLRFNQRVRNPQYANEVNKSLKEMRDSMNWNYRYWRDTLIKAKLHELPKLKSLTRKTYGFQGKRIVKKNHDRPNANWEIEKYKFL